MYAHWEGARIGRVPPPGSAWIKQLETLFAAMRQAGR